jgi:hypothetical protein
VLLARDANETAHHAPLVPLGANDGTLVLLPNWSAEEEHERGVASCTPSVALGEDGAAEDPRDDRSDGATAWMLVACTGRGAASSVARHYRPLDDDMEVAQDGL